MRVSYRVRDDEERKNHFRFLFSSDPNGVCIYLFISLIYLSSLVKKCIIETCSDSWRLSNDLHWLGVWFDFSLIWNIKCSSERLLARSRESFRSSSTLDIPSIDRPSILLHLTMTKYSTAPANSCFWEEPPRHQRSKKEKKELIHRHEHCCCLRCLPTNFVMLFHMHLYLRTFHSKTCS